MSKQKSKRKVRSCKELSELFPAYVDGELESSACKTVAHHLKLCSICRADAALIRGLSSNLAKIEEERVPAGFTESVIEQVFRCEVGLVERILALLTMPRAAVLVAAAAVVAFTMMGTSWNPWKATRDGSEVATSANEPGLLEMPYLSVRSGRVTMHGITHVHTKAPVPLGHIVEGGALADAVIVYPKRSVLSISEGTRLVCAKKEVHLQQGDVRVSVAKNAKFGVDPVFRVFTPNARVSVWGTEFVVSHDDEGSTQVNVLEGVVGVQSICNGVLGPEKRINAGYGASIRSQGEVKVQKLHAAASRHPEPVQPLATGADEALGPAYQSEDTTIKLGDGN